MGDRINEGFFFYKKMYAGFAVRPKKSGRNNEVAVVGVPLYIYTIKYHF